MNSPRHQLTDKILDKMRQKGIKPTHLKNWFNTAAINRFYNYEASFMMLFTLEDIIDKETK